MSSSFTPGPLIGWNLENDGAGEEFGDGILKSKEGFAPFQSPRPALILLSPKRPLRMTFVLGSNARGPMYVTDGTTTLFKETQLVNAHSPMDVTESGMTMDFKEKQPLNADSLMDVTESGMTTDSREVHYLNASSPMDVTESGTR